MLVLPIFCAFIHCTFSFSILLIVITCRVTWRESQLQRFIVVLQGFVIRQLLFVHLSVLSLLPVRVAAPVAKNQNNLWLRRMKMQHKLLLLPLAAVTSVQGRSISSITTATETDRFINVFITWSRRNLQTPAQRRRLWRVYSDFYLSCDSAPLLSSRTIFPSRCTINTRFQLRLSLLQHETEQHKIRLEV